MTCGDGGTMTRAELAERESEEIRINRRNAADAILDRLEQAKDAVEEAFANPKRNSLRALWLDGQGRIQVGCAAQVRDLLEVD